MRTPATVRALPAALLIAGAAMIGSSHTGAAAVSPCGVAAGALQASTASDLYSLSIGSPEAMYSPSEAAAKHPASGEVMLRGAMSDVPGPPAPERHLEVHICSSATGAVVQDASPTITLADTAPGSTPQTLPVAVMQGVGQGISDVHYGNNVLLPSDATYVVTIAQAADRVAFEFTLGPDGIIWGRPTQAAAPAAPPAPPATSGQTPPAAPMPPGTAATTPRTGVLSDATPAAGFGAALVGVVLCLSVRAWPARRSGRCRGTRGRR